jgi:hypothetical protein
MNGNGINTIDKKIVFIQYDIPPLKSGEYSITIKQDVKNQGAEPFTLTRKFAVTGERFAFDPADINTVYPQNLANGDFSGVLPHVVFNRKTLPWERTLVESQLRSRALSEVPAASWLAVLLFNEDELPTVTKMVAKDLVAVDTTITVEGSSKTDTGKMPKEYISYPGMEKMGYGETPDLACNIIDVPAEIFSKITPTKFDLNYLSHIREVETIDKDDKQSEKDEFYAVVLGNRLPLDNATSYCMLVSLENMGNYLPGADSKNNLPAGTKFVRLITYVSWSFTVNQLNEDFKKLLENLNKDRSGNQGLTNLSFPFLGTAPDGPQVQTALQQQAAGTLETVGANVLVQNAFMMGYSPYNHFMRHAGNIVTWYRGPLSPYGVSENIKTPLSCSDAGNRYNPETGMFDVSYGAAWQLGQLLALQNKGFAAALYNWKKSQDALEITKAEQKIIEDKYRNLTAFGDIFSQRKKRLDEPEPLPDLVVKWLGRLSVLNGVPFNYLVPDERMLPPESIRFFYLDNNWIDALLDGAFSIGRSASAEVAKDEPRMQLLKPHAKQAARRLRRQKISLLNYINETAIVSGFLLRSAVLRGWPGLEVNGYSDEKGFNEIPKMRMERLSDEVMICLFDGKLQMAAVHQPPEVLHCGTMTANGTRVTSLRMVKGDHPGSELQGHTAPITVRADNQSVNVVQSAADILKTLNDPPLSEGITQFTSAEFALEMIKGVIKVEFAQQP